MLRATASWLRSRRGVGMDELSDEIAGDDDLRGDDVRRVLIEKMRIVDVRRNYHGTLFWQMPSIVLGAVVLVMGNAAKGQMPWWAITAIGVVLLLICRIAYSLMKSQNQLEDKLSEIELRIAELIGDPDPLRLPRSNKYGSRFTIVVALGILGAVTILLGLLVHFGVFSLAS